MARSLDAEEGELQWHEETREPLQRLAEYVTGLSESAIGERGSFSLFLSGSSFLMSCLRNLTEEPHFGKIDWSNWHVVWANETVVPPHQLDTIDNTLGHHGFLTKVPAGQVHIMDVKISPQAIGSVDYELVLRELVRTRGSTLPVAQTSPVYPRFDLILVGTELDQLVASVFTFPPVVQKSEIRTALSDDESRPPLLDRGKFTLPVVNSGANVSFVAARSGKADEMKLICSAKSPFGDIPANPTAAAPYKANLVWFKQLPMQMEVRGVNCSFDHVGEGTKFGCCGSSICDHTFHWQSQIGGIYRPTLEVVEELVDSLLISPVQRTLVLEHARNGLKYENLWNWGEAIEYYKAMDAELGKQLEASERKENDQLISLWMHTWATVPILWFQQFVKGDLNECIAGWEKLRNQWPSGTLENLSMRRHQALAMLELSHKNRNSIDAAVQAAAVELYPNERSPPDGDFMETLPTMSDHLHQHYKFAADEAKAKQWLQKTLEYLAGHADISMPRYPVVLNRFKMLKNSRDIVDLEMAEDLMRKLQGDLEKRKGKRSRAQITSSSGSAVGDVAERWRDMYFEMAYQRHREKFPGVENFTNDKSIEYSLKIIEKDLSTDTFGDCLRTSKHNIVQERFEDALMCLDLALHKLPREPGFHNLQRKVVLRLMVECHLGLSRNKSPESGFSHITAPPSHTLLELSEPYLRNVMGIADDEIQAAMRQIAWKNSHSDASTGSINVYLENVISCYRKALALSSLPGGFTVLRFEDLSQLGNQLFQKESSLFAQWCRGGEVTTEVYLKAWNEAWGVLQKFSELSSRLMHARWDPLYIEMLSAGNVFEKFYELLSHKLNFARLCFLKTLHPHPHPGVLISKHCPAVKELVTFHGDLEQMFQSFCARSMEIDCALPAYVLRKLMYSERGRARTLLLQGGSLLTTEARHHFLQFSLDDNIAGDAMRRSISACGRGCVFVSLSTSSWRIYSTIFYEVRNPFSHKVQGLVWETEIQDEACLSLRGILQKTLELLSGSWLSSQLEEKSRQLDEYLEQLFEIVVRPIELALKDMSPEQKLIFCASKDLTSIPFPILRNRETGRYLFQDHTISVTPSLRVLHPCSQRYEALKKRPLAKGNSAAGVVIADPKYPDEGGSKPVWRRLQGSGNEANKICSLFSGSSGTYRVEKLQREKATVENLLCQAQLPSSDLSFQGFIHVAAHAKVDKKHYPRGVLALSQVSSKDDDGDSSDSEEFNSDSDAEGDKEGSQNTRAVAATGSAFGEVAAGICRGPATSKVASKDAAMMISADGIVSCGFEWSAALVVLSACDSVKGELYPEGVHNLPRAFMMAGVPCVVVSQWKVSDDFSPKLMEIFYTCLREGMDVASALRFAMCQMLEEKHCLHHFAPFLVWGLPNVCLPEELQSKPPEHDQPISQDIAAGSKSSKLAAMVQDNNNGKARVVNDDKVLNGNLESSSSDHQKTPSVREKASSSGSERETMVPDSPAQNSAPEAPSAMPRTTPSTSPKEFQGLSRGQVLLENFTHNYLLDKTSEGICLRIGARALTITLGDNTRCWEWVYRHKGAMFCEVAVLKEVSRLEAKGRFQCSLPPGTYTLSWRLLCYGDILAFTGPSVYGFIDPLKFSLEVTGNEPVHTQCRLTASGAKASMHQRDGVQQELAWRWDPSEWMELDVGQFSVGSNDSLVEVRFSMEETDEHKSKMQMSLDGIVIRPSTLFRQDQAIIASGSGLHDTGKGFVSYYETGTANREALLARPAPPRGDHDAWHRELLLFKKMCRSGLAKEDHSSIKAAKAESQLEGIREEIYALKATNARLEHARRAQGITLLGELQRVMEEKSALEADIVRLQEQVVKTEANVREKKKVAADDVQGRI